jgi:hypothetical protein
MTTINITTVQVGPYDLLGSYPTVAAPLGCTLGNLSPEMKATVAAGRLAGYSPVLVFNIDTNAVAIEMR